MTDKEILEEIEYNVLNDPFTTFNQDSSYESVQIKATAIEELVKRFERQQKEIEELKKEKRILIEKYADVVYECGKRNEEIQYLKKRLYRKGVFSKEKFVRFYPKQYQNDYVKKWVDESDGLTPREMEELGYDVLKDCLI